MAAYYNEIEPYAAQWIRNLIGAGMVAPGEVDERSIEEVKPDDIREFTQCHFFAGIGVWSYALRLANWPDDRPVWTGSCPCQPFSVTGERGGTGDARHLWPVWYELIKQRTPIPLFGEQVSDGGGPAWLDIVQTDLEAAGYTFGALDLCSASIGAPTIRQRAYWLGNPSARDWKDTPGTKLTRADGRSRIDQAPRQAAIMYRPEWSTDIGLERNGESVQTGRKDRYSAEHSRWLQGIPSEWKRYAPTATQLTRR